MRTEVPVFKRCCFCIPVRHGLLIWGYLNLLPSTLLVLAGIFECIYLSQYGYHYGWMALIRFGVAFLVKITNFAFTFVLIVAAHRKSSRLLKIYYCYELIAVVAIFVLLISEFVFDLIDLWGYSFMWRYVLLQALACIVYIGLQLYILAIVRSEILKLDSQHEFRFTNIAAEAECEYYNKQVNTQMDTQENTQTDKHENEQLNIDTTEKEDDSLDSIHEENVAIV